MLYLYLLKGKHYSGYFSAYIWLIKCCCCLHSISVHSHFKLGSMPPITAHYKSTENTLNFVCINKCCCQHDAVNKTNKTLLSMVIVRRLQGPLVEGDKLQFNSGWLKADRLPIHCHQSQSVCVNEHSLSATHLFATQLSANWLYLSYTNEDIKAYLNFCFRSTSFWAKLKLIS